MGRRIFAVGGIVGLVVLASSTVEREREAGACSCRGPETALVGPDRVDDVPLNTKVRIETPVSGAAPSIVLRVHGSATETATSTRTIAPGGWLSLVELTPSQPLEPATQYEVATIDPNRFPPVTVLGTFRTGRATDATPPRLDPVGVATAFVNNNPMGSACQVGGPWVTIEGVHSEDPSRPAAQLVYGVWRGDATGAFDTKKPPTAIVSAREGSLHLGQTSLCDPRAFPMPGTPVMWLGIAAIDEAGNVSAVRRVRVDLAGAHHP